MTLFERQSIYIALQCPRLVQALNRYFVRQGNGSFEVVGIIRADKFTIELPSNSAKPIFKDTLKPELRALSQFLGSLHTRNLSILKHFRDYFWYASSEWLSSVC